MKKKLKKDNYAKLGKIVVLVSVGKSKKLRSLVMSESDEATLIEFLKQLYGGTIKVSSEIIDGLELVKK